MTEADFTRNEWRLGAAYRTSYASAYTGASVPRVVSQIFYDSDIGRAECVDAKQWMKDVNSAGSKASRDTVKTLHANDTGVIALELRDDVRNAARRIRHIYNLFFTLADKIGASFSEIRNRLVYAVILEDSNRPGNSSAPETDALSDGLLRLARDTWEYDISEIQGFNNKNDERRLTGLICQKAYLLYKNEVGAFARSKGII